MPSAITRANPSLRAARRALSPIRTASQKLCEKSTIHGPTDFRSFQVPVRKRTARPMALAAVGRVPSLRTTPQADSRSRSRRGSEAQARSIPRLAPPCGEEREEGREREDGAPAEHRSRELRRLPDRTRNTGPRSPSAPVLDPVRTRLRRRLQRGDRRSPPAVCVERSADVHSFVRNAKVPARRACDYGEAGRARRAARYPNERRRGEDRRGSSRRSRRRLRERSRGLPEAPATRSHRETRVSPPRTSMR